MQLFLLRHAKSSWAESSVPDHDRPLNARGERAASLVGAHLAQQQTPPSLVLCSSALRTVQTLERVVALLPEAPAQSVERELYLAEPEVIFARVRAVDADHQRVMVIGHNPGIAVLAAALAARGASDARARLARKFPTAALAELRFNDDDWSTARPGSAELLSFWTPKDLV